MSERDVIWQEKRLYEIMYSNATPTEKVQQIVRLGFDDEVAEELVERHESGSKAPVYYETLEFDAEYEESQSERKRREDNQKAA